MQQEQNPSPRSGHTGSVPGELRQPGIPSWHTHKKQTGPKPLCWVKIRFIKITPGLEKPETSRTAPAAQEGTWWRVANLYSRQQRIHSAHPGALGWWTPNPPPGAYQHGAVPQEVEVAVLAEEVTLGVRGVELLAAHDEVVGEITPWGGRTDGQTERGGHHGELLPAAGSGGLRPQGGFVPKATSPKPFWFWAREGAGVKERPF